MNRFNPLLYVILIIFMMQCDTPKNVVSAITCDTTGTIVDMTGLDGCQWLIVTDDGTKVLPQNWPNDFEPKDQLMVKFHATKVDNGMNTCMAEDMTASIDCIEPLAGKPAKPKCEDTVDPMSVKWMKIAMVKNGTNVVEKYQYLDKFAYLFKGVNLVNNLYDCQGTLLCTYQEIEQNACSMQVVNLGKKTIIWRGR